MKIGGGADGAGRQRGHPVGVVEGARRLGYRCTLRHAQGAVPHPLGRTSQVWAKVRRRRAGATARCAANSASPIPVDATHRAARPA
jgi:hypothetical protein